MKNQAIQKLLEEAAKLVTGTKSYSSFRSNPCFDNESVNWFFVVGIGKDSGFVELLQPSRTIIRTCFPREAVKHVKQGDLIEVVTSPSVRVTRIGRISLHSFRRSGRKRSFKAVWYQPEPDVS